MNTHEFLADARRQTDRLFDLVRPDALYERPIPERHRIIFYLGHLEAFAVFTGQHGVGFLVALESLLRRVEIQLAADATFDRVEVDLVVLEVLFHALETLARVLVLGERSWFLAERLLVAEAIADVAQVAQRAGQMALQNVGVEILDFAAADGLDEIAEVIVAAGELLDDLAIVAVGDGVAVAGADQETFAAVEDVADIIGRLELRLGTLLAGVR